MASTAPADPVDVADDVSEEHLRQIFNVMDVNGDGNINIQELNEGLKHAGLSRRTQSLFQVLDTDHLGVVDFQHFKKVGSSFLNTMGSDSDDDDDDEEEVTVLHQEGHHLKAAAKAVLFMQQASRKTSKPPQQAQEHHHIATDIRLRQWDRLRTLQSENDAFHELQVEHTWVITYSWTLFHFCINTFVPRLSLSPT